MGSKKLGRPTDSPKNNKLTVRLDEISNSKLNRYCEENGIGRAEAIRRLLSQLDSK